MRTTLSPFVIFRIGCQLPAKKNGNKVSWDNLTTFSVPVIIWLKSTFRSEDKRSLRNHLRKYFVFLGALFTLSLPLLAGCATKDDKWPVTTVAWIKHHQGDFVVDEVPATLVGKVTHQYGRYIYFFFDGTGKIQLYSEIQLPEGKPIVVKGNVDEDSFNVTSWHSADKPDENRK